MARDRSCSACCCAGRWVISANSAFTASEVGCEAGLVDAEANWPERIWSQAARTWPTSNPATAETAASATNAKAYQRKMLKVSGLPSDAERFGGVCGAITCVRASVALVAGVKAQIRSGAVEQQWYGVTADRYVRVRFISLVRLANAAGAQWMRARGRQGRRAFFGG